ncbi:hypothetical protein MKW94_003828 [Papaver nudicaule]|uniref:Calmodulin-binding domain-containing protein n=1 Tax=Papaver nudicaule TaxID=74823 RepID=A0AA42AUP0_PAPNU|nr:hypothetical protein [Papaver nudicaule]
MAAEGMETPPTSDRVAPEDRNARRNSTEKKKTSGSGEKVIPHYLRASTNSCHEFCKYGRKHDSEEEKRPTLKELRAKMIQDRKAGKTVNEVEIKYTPLKSKTLPDQPVQVYETPKIIKETASSKRENSSEQKASPNQLVRVSETPKMMKKETTSFKRTNVSKPKSSPDQLIQGLETTKTMKKETTSFKRTNSSEPKVSPDQLVRVLEKPKIIKKEATSFKRTNVSAKPSTAKLSLSPLSTSGGVTDRRTSDSKVLKTAGVSKISQKKAVVLPKASLSPRLSVTRVSSLITKSKVPKTASSPLRNQKAKKDGSNLPNNEEVREKTLYIINSKPEEGSLQSGYNLTRLPETDVEKELRAGEAYKETEYTTDETLSETDEDVNENPLDKEKYKRKPRRSVHVEDEELARKLNFRRGKVVNPQAENNGARRLKFNRGKMIESNQNGANDNRRRYRKSEVNNDDANNGKPDSENVVLRHQDAQGKKDTQGLYNNVIEETASKLVEKRKSKVKALVGAFETVISLQESQPSSHQH